MTADLPIDDRAQRLAITARPWPPLVLSARSLDHQRALQRERGELAAERVLASDPFTAAVTFNDVMAAGMMRTCHQRQFSCRGAVDRWL